MGYQLLVIREETEDRCAERQKTEEKNKNEVLFQSSVWERSSLQSSVFSLQSSVFSLQSSVFCLLSSVFCLLS